MSSQCQPLRGCPQRSYGFQDLKERTKSRCVEHTGKPTRNPPFLPRLCQRRVVGDASWNDWKDWIGIGVTGVILHSGRCSEVAAFCHCAFLLCLCHSICHSVYVCTMLCILAYLFDVLMQLARDSLSTSKSNQCKKWIQMVSCSRLQESQQLPDKVTATVAMQIITFDNFDHLQMLAPRARFGLVARVSRPTAIPSPRDAQRPFWKYTETSQNQHFFKLKVFLSSWSYNRW